MSSLNTILIYICSNMASLDHNNDSRAENKSPSEQWNEWYGQFALVSHNNIMPQQVISSECVIPYCCYILQLFHIMNCTPIYGFCITSSKQVSKVMHIWFCGISFLVFVCVWVYFRVGLKWLVMVMMTLMMIVLIIVNSISTALYIALIVFDIVY